MNYLLSSLLHLFRPSFRCWRVGTKFLSLFFCLLLLFFNTSIFADVVKPALIEISANTNGSVEIEIRTSIEALLTGINGRYKNTKEAPNAEKYDTFRLLQAEQLQPHFQQFQTQFLQQIWLKANGVKIPLNIVSIHIPERGYVKVPRISLITLTASLDRNTQTLQWYYPASFGDNAVRVRQVDEIHDQWHWSEWQWLRNDQASETFSLEALFTQRPILQVIGEYIVIGFEHILPKGLDHILFIFGLFLFSLRLKPLLWQITMFTVAHTITLGLAMNGILSLPANIVEPLIALSIAYVGIENIVAKSLHHSRLFLVFAFGLLHGLGFASVLSDFGMPADAFITALISFNIGVELGQLTIIALAFFSLAFWFGQKSWYRQVVVIPFSLIISAVALYWTLDRLLLI